MPNRTNSHSASPLTLLLFGRPEVFLAGRPVEPLRRKNRALLFYLAGHARPQARDHLLSLFWPDHPRAAAQQTLRTMLHDLRRRLGDAVVGEMDTLALASDTDVDARRFEAGLSARTPEPSAVTTLLEIYRGDFLEGFALADAPPFDDWVHAERERYRLLAIRALTTLSELHASRREWSAALSALDRALGFDPLQEELQRRALRFQALAGDRPGAIRRYESLRQTLDDEMGVPPMPETRALYDAIITDTLPVEDSSRRANMPAIQPHVAPSDNRLPFVGRTREIETLVRSASGGKLVVLEGEPGIGKTRLALEFIARFPEALVLIGSAHELEQGMPYQPVADALSGLAARPEWSLRRAQLELAPVWQDELARLVPDLFPVPAPSSSRSEEPRMWQALDRLLLGLAQKGQVIFLLDDLHWADPSTVGWLSYLARHPFPPRLLVMATTRSAEGRAKLAPLFQSLARQERLERLPLDALGPPDLRKLAERLEPARADSLADWLTRHTEGNPFFVTEMVRYARARSWNDAGSAGESAAFPDALVPEGIHDLIAARLTRVSTGARRVLDGAAVIGREFDASLVMRVSALDEAAVLDAFDELRAEALIQSLDRGRFAFDHQLTMQVVLQEMSDIRRVALHRRVAQALEEFLHGAPDPMDGLVAHHWAQADAPGRVALHAFRAGQFAVSIAAWTEAIAFYEQALATETDAAQRTAILLALSSAHFDRGDLAQASDASRLAIRQAVESRDLARLEQAHLALNMSYYAQGHYAEAVSAAQELRQSCPPDLTLAAEFMWGMALSLQSARPAEAELHLREAERLMATPRSFKSRVTPATLKYQLAGPLGQQGRIREAIELYREALALVAADEASLDLQRRVLLYNSLAYYLYLEGDPAAAEHARAGLKLAREKGTLTHQAYLLSTSGEIALAQQDWAGAQALFEEGLTIAEMLNIPERIAGLTANLGRVAQQRGEGDRARELLTKALVRSDQLGASHLAVRIRIWLVPLLQEPERARRLREAREMADSSGFGRLVEEIAQLERAFP